ncbi:MAG: hypothetical protein M1822_001163 [Bathelium mastoideum]|nr:MAG: hypothetical protein M1822_001163 [Bathelium mastoideum]
MRSDSTPHGIFPEISSPSNLASGRSSIRSQPTSIASDPVAGLARRPLPHDVRSKPEVPTFVSPWDSTTCQLAKPEAPPAEAVPLEVITPSTTHWLSPETRAKQYAEIERTCRGWRGFWKKATKSEKKARQTQDHLVDFYDEKDVDDCASVRRYRIDIEDDDDEKDGELEMDSNDRGEPKCKRKGWFGGAR